MAETKRLVSAGSAATLPPGELRRVCGEPPVTVYNVDGTFYATDDWCSHDKASLADGWLEGDTIECPWHMAKFCVRTGKALTAPARTDIRTFAVLVEEGELFVDLGDAA